MNEESETEVNYTVCGRPAKHKVLKKGRPPELAELLYAIERKVGRVYGFAAQRADTNGNNGVFFTLEREMKDSQVVASYNLTKSLRENIESNEGLAKFLLEIL